MPDIVVLGAGIIGLSTALCIQRRIPDARVTIIADKFDKDTVSDGAAGAFIPSTEHIKARTIKQLIGWSKASFSWFDTIYRSEEGPEAGIIRINGYEVMREKKELPLHRLMNYHFRELSNDELQKLPGNYRYGIAYTTLLIESRRYLPWLMKKFLSSGGTVVEKTIQNIMEFSEAYDVTVNCLGMSCRWLLNDQEMFPVRGHLVRVEAPWIKEFFIVSDGDMYMYPGQDNVILGGTRHEGEYDLDYKEEHFKGIMDRCSKLFPSLKNAKLHNVWGGVRPHRTTIRVEKEIMKSGNNLYKVVHNYGHGTHGVALSWGTAEYATALTFEILQQKGQRELVMKPKL